VAIDLPQLFETPADDSGEGLQRRVLEVLLGMVRELSGDRDRRLRPGQGAASGPLGGEEDRRQLRDLWNLPPWCGASKAPGGEDNSAVLMDIAASSETARELLSLPFCERFRLQFYRKFRWRRS
jgi:hypothetical protein